MFIGVLRLFTSLDNLVYWIGLLTVCFIYCYALSCAFGLEWFCFVVWFAVTVYLF